MSDIAIFRVSPCFEMSASNGRIFIRVIGENNAPGVNDALSRLDDFRVELGQRNISHQTSTRKGYYGEEVVDCVSFNKTS